jgi:hypothetical protein
MSMYDTLKHPDDQLLYVEAGAQHLTCASEAIPAVPRGGHRVAIPHETWPTYPWAAHTQRHGWQVAGRVIGSDEDHVAFVSGCDYFMFGRTDVSVQDKGPDAEVPAELL